MDLWRTPEITSNELGLESYLAPGVVLAVEWALPIVTELSPLVHAYRVTLTVLDENRRQIAISHL